MQEGRKAGAHVGDAGGSLGDGMGFLCTTAIPLPLAGALQRRVTGILLRRIDWRVLSQGRFNRRGLVCAPLHVLVVTVAVVRLVL